MPYFENCPHRNVLYDDGRRSCHPCRSSLCSPQADSLRQAVKELRDWRADHDDILRSIGFCSGLPESQSRSLKTVNSTGDHASSKGAVSDAGASEGGDTGVAMIGVGGSSPPGSAGVVSTGEEVVGSNGRGAKITLQNLSACIHAAEKIAVGRSLKEVREMRAVLQRANDWIEQCQTLCPRRQSKRRVQPSSKPTFERLKSLIAVGLASPVGVSDEVDRIRRHIAEAESCQNNAKSVLDSVCSALAEQTIERREIWRKEDEEFREFDHSEGISSGPPKAPGNSAGASSVKQFSDTSKLPVQPNDEQAKLDGGKNRKLGAADAGKDDDSNDDDSDGVDREDELDEAEDSIKASLEQVLSTARDITIFMPEELVVEKVQKIIEWARYDETVAVATPSIPCQPDLEGTLRSIFSFHLIVLARTCVCCWPQEREGKRIIRRRRLAAEPGERHRQGWQRGT